jgi:hypothetical protein
MRMKREHNATIGRRVANGPKRKGKERKGSFAEVKMVFLRATGGFGMDRIIMPGQLNR